MKRDYYTTNDELSEIISEVYKHLNVDEKLDNLLLQLIEKQKQFNQEVVWALMDLDSDKQDW